MVISIEALNVFGKIQHPFTITTDSIQGIGRSFLHDHEYLKKIQTVPIQTKKKNLIKFRCEILKAFIMRLGISHRYQLSTYYLGQASQTQMPASFIAIGRGGGLWNLRINLLPKAFKFNYKAKPNQDRTKQKSLDQPNKISAGQI